MAKKPQQAPAEAAKTEEVVELGLLDQIVQEGRRF